MKTPKDQYKQTLMIGDYITYPARKRSQLYNRTAKVLEVLPPDFNSDKNITRLKVLTAIIPRAEERKQNRNWKADIKYVKTIIENTWKATKLSEEIIKSDSRYVGLLNQ